VNDKGPCYKEIGQGMGAALNMASASNAYVLSDRGTWLAFQNRGDLVIAVEGDKRLFNQYGVMLVNSAKCPSVKKDLGQQFIDFLISPEGQRIIAGTRSTASSFSIRTLTTRTHSAFRSQPRWLCNRPSFRLCWQSSRRPMPP
jgi:ABC-type tungstate transport system permease subunit